MSPESSPKTVADRIRDATLTGVHPRKNGDLIPTPDDILEGRGNFGSLDASGNPEGLRIGRVENPDGWDALIGSTPDTTTQQNTSPLPLERPTFVANQPLVVGPPAPSPNDPLLAKIAQPETPLLKAIKVDVVGFPPTTPQSPLWYAYCWVRRGNLTLPSLPVSFQVAAGQGVEVSWKDPPPEAEGVAIFLPKPGTSSATNPGAMYEQRRLFFSSYKTKTYPLNGPFRTGRLLPTKNETLLNTPPAPSLFRFTGGGPSRAGAYAAKAVAANDRGQTLASATSNAVVVPQNAPVDSRPGAGFYIVRIERPTLPAGSTGWYPYIQISGYDGGKWQQVYDRATRQGLSQPYPASRQYVFVFGWTPNEDYGEGAGVLIQSAELPKENNTGMAGPDSAPDTPIAFGQARPPAGRRWARVVERVGKRRTIASNPVYLDLAFDEVLAVVYRKHTNLLPNGDNIEVSAGSLPLYHTVDKTGGDARVIGTDFVMWTNASQADGATTPTDVTDPVGVNPSVGWAVQGEVAVEDPPTGTRAGSLQVFIREYNASGTATDTTILTASAVGEYRYHQFVAPVGTPPGSGIVVARSDTVSASVGMRIVP